MMMEWPTANSHQEFSVIALFLFEEATDSILIWTVEIRKRKNEDTLKR